MISKRFILVLLLAVAGMAAKAQSVIRVTYNGNDYYLTHNEAGTSVETTPSNNFDPSTCIWYLSNNTIQTANANGDAFSGNNYLQNNAVTLGGSSTWTTAQNGSEIRIRRNNQDQYLRYSPSSNAWQINTYGNHATAYAVNIQTVAAVTTVTTVPTISPLSAELNYNDSQAFTASATATTEPAYTIYTFNNNTVYYFNNTAYASEAAMKASAAWASATAAPTITYTWTLTGAANSYLSPISGSGTNITITHSTPAPSDLNSVLSVTASATANGVSDSKTSTSNATVTALAPQDDPESITVTSPMTVYVGQTGAISYTLTPNPCYNNVTYTSNNTSIATVDNNGVVTGVAVGTATITVTAKKIDGTTTPALTGTVTVNVRNICSTPTITFAQIGDGATANTTITSTTGADIYYTINGADPTTSSTHYTGSFQVNDGDVVRAIAVMTGNPSWDNSAVATEEYHACGTNDPTITYVQSSSTATVTISAETGATIYYTTDGNDPTTSSSNGTTSVTINNVANGTVVKAFAKNSTCSASSIVSKEIVISGISGGVVTLNDLEDHSWSYYSDALTPSYLHSLNPADVKITYYGDGIVMTGNDDYTASSVAETDYIMPGNANYVGGAKVNVGGENENTFIYYKTLERGDATDAAWTYSAGNQSSAASRCPYTPIYNPFYVRPTYGERTVDANDFTGWRGFQCWRLKSVTGGTVYSAASGGSALAVGAVIDAGTPIYFAPNSEYGMEVEMEAVWARAYLIKGNQAGANSILPRTEGVERNFMTLTSGENYRFNGTQGRCITNVDYPVTISCYYPSGEAPANTNSTVSGNNNNITLQANTKFENVRINVGNNSVTANGYDLIIGRGCGNSTVGTLQGIDENKTNLDYMLRVESGTYNTFSFVRNTNTTVSGRYMVRGIMGCDYDRATNTNNKLSVSASSPLFFSTYVTYSSNTNKDQKTFDCVFKSGSYQSSYWPQDSNGNGDYQHSTYLGQNSAGNTYPGMRYVIVEGGEFGSLNGGRGVGSESTDYATPEVITFDLKIKGGLFHGGVYGAAADNPSIGSRRFIITGGEIQGWIAGGCNGTGSTNGSGATNGNSYIYVGGNTIVGGSGPRTINGTPGGQVFGAGRGLTGDTRLSYVNNSHVAIADNATISNASNAAQGGGNVYGGSYNGNIHDTSNVYILGGTVNGKVFGGSYGNVGDGGAQKIIPVANVTMTGGLVTNGVYGGSNTKGTVQNTNLYINGGQVGTSSANANVHGGGYGQSTIVSQNVEVTVGDGCNATEGVTVYGDVYGGSALGSVNGTAATNNYHTYVTLYAGTINGSLYGGALGATGTAANVYGPVQVKVFGGSVKKTDANGANGSGGVYGCNNINGAPQRAVAVDIYGTDPAPSEDEYAIFSVYGGGNQANYAYGTPTVTVHNCNNSIEYVYGGGNAAHITNGNTDVTIYGGNKIGNVFGGGNGTVTPANVSGNTNVKIYGGTILRVFGGSNSQGNIGGTISVNAQSLAETGDDPCGNAYVRCPIQVGELYGGGNMAASNAGNITIGCMEADDMIDYVYGGANQANITGNIYLDIKGGRVGNLFGGNNHSGDINGNITIDVNWNDNCSDNYLGNVFGGGNEAAYDRTPDVNIMNGTVSGNVYGGGNEAGVAGGDVVMTGGTVLGGLYGGCNTSGVVSGDIIVSITGGTIGSADSLDAHITADVFGGGYGAATSTTGDVLVVINGASVNIYGDVYGGSALGNVNGSGSNTTTVNILDGTLHSVTDNTSGFTVYHGGNVYGGGLGDATHAAAVNGVVIVNIGSGTLNPEHPEFTIATSGNATIGGNVYGCNNTNGSPQQNVTVNVFQTAHTADNSVNGTGFAIANVFGGGNQANYTASGSIKVNVYSCDNTIGRVFGGGDAAATKGVETNIQGGRFDQVFGGGNGETGAPGADVNGNVNLNIHGGTVGEFYGGSNQNGEIHGSINIDVDNDSGCGLNIDEFFCGGNFVNITGGLTTTINCSDGMEIANLYGGCNQAYIDGDVILNVYGGIYTNVFGGSKGRLRETNGPLDEGISANIYGKVFLNLYGGTIENVFGGSNVQGNINGTIVVNVLDIEGECPLYITNIYGGSNLTSYTPTDATFTSPLVNVVHAKYGISGNVYGGSKGLVGYPATVKANPRVNIGYDQDMIDDVNNVYLGNYVRAYPSLLVSPRAIVAGSVYGGCDAAEIKGNTAIYLRNRSKVFGNIYGGGNMGEVTGNTKVIVNGANQ